MKGKLELKATMKSADVGTFCCHIVLPNASEFFGSKNAVTEKRFVILLHFSITRGL